MPLSTETTQIIRRKTVKKPHYHWSNRPRQAVLFSSRNKVREAVRILEGGALNSVFYAVYPLACGRYSVIRLSDEKYLASAILGEDRKRLND